MRWVGAASGWQLRQGVMLTAAQLRPVCPDERQRQLLAWVWQLGLWVYVWERVGAPRPLVKRFVEGFNASVTSELASDSRLGAANPEDIERHVRTLVQHFHAHLDDQAGSVQLSITAGTAGLWLASHGLPSNIKVMTYLAATISTVQLAHADLLRQLPSLDQQTITTA